MTVPPDAAAGLPRSVIDAALNETAAEVRKLLPSDAAGSAFQYGGGVARTLVAFYAGREVGWALDVTADEATLVGGIAAAGLVLGWSVLQKRWAAWRTHQAALASGAASAQATALAGAPVVVALEPPPNKV